MPGHTGYYCEHLLLLFSADLFASYHGTAHFPPDIFTRAGPDAGQRRDRDLRLDLTGIIPNHCDRAEPEEHLERLRRLHAQANF